MFSYTSRIVFSFCLSQTLIQHLSVFSRGIIPSAESKTVKRNALTYPPSSLFQVTLGVSIEGDIERNLAGFSLALQHNANLPQDAANFITLQGASFRDFSLYDHLRKTMTRYGFNGVECLKKMICQIAEAPLKGGILEDIITFALTPSKHGKKRQSLTERDLDENEMDVFLEPEAEGKSGKNCTFIYSNCNNSPLDFFTHVEIL